MLGELDPKVPSLLTGKERVLDTATLRASLGILSMGLQASNSVNISGGVISSTTINSPTISNGSWNNPSIYNGNIYSAYLSSPYIYNGNIYSAYLSSPYISNASYAVISGDTTLNGRLILNSALYITNATLSNEIVSYVKGSGALICVGTPTNPCSSYSYGSCPTAIGCSPQEVYCPNYNGDQTTCEGYGCTYESVTVDCGSTYYDSYSCNNDTSCGGWQEPTGNCSEIGDEYTCNSAGGGMYCGWVGASMSPCSGLTDESSCNAQGECGGWTDDGMGGFYCAGTDYTTSPAYCGGSTYPSGSPYCAGSYNYYTGNCIGSGGYCAGTASCTPLSSGACTSYAGCTTQSGINITVPNGTDNQFRMIMNIDPSGSDVILNYNSTTKTLANFEDYVILHFKRIPHDCGSFTDESSCIAKSGCGWYYDEGTSTYYCSGTWYEEQWYNFS